MKIAVKDAKAELSGLIARAANGERVVITKRGKPVAEIRPVHDRNTPIQRHVAAKRIIEGAKSTERTPAARSADFLYDDEGLPS